MEHVSRASRKISSVLDGYFAGETSVQAQHKTTGSRHDVGLGSEQRCADQFAARIGDQQRVTILQFRSQRTQGCVFVSRVKNDVAFSRLGGYHGRVRSARNVGGKLNREDGVIEPHRRNRRIDKSPVGIDQYILGMDACDLKHAAEEGGLVFTVAVTIAKDIGSRVGQVAVADLDLYIADFRLQESG